MDYWDAVDYLLALPDQERFSNAQAAVTMSLEAMKALLSKLGNPQRDRKTIHVTGSKGKGSTSSMIASILHERGEKVALYTSPHLHDYNERTNFAMLPVSRFDFADGVAEIRDAIDEVNTGELGPVSTFGALTALFFHLCRKNGVDWQVVEVGLGGAQDATNVFDRKEAAVITPISLEHTQVLGSTCAAIAAEKAGIITKGTKVIMAHQQDAQAAKVIEEQATRQKASLIDVAAKYRVVPTAHDAGGQSFILESPHRRYDLHTMMLGLHQLQNAATAVATIEAVLGTSDEDSWAVEDGIGSVEVAGRLEQLTRHPLVVVDGAHNHESMEALVEALDRHFDFERCFFVIGVNGDKNIDEMLQAIKPMTPKGIIATCANTQRALPASKIAEHARKLGLEAHETQNVEQALAVVRELAELNDLVCITGSLYVVGEARQSILALPVTH